MNNLLRIENLNAFVEKKQILKDFNLIINENEIHIIMGPNGSGKSTLSKILAGHPLYEIKQGNIIFNEKNLLEMSPEMRSHEGIFLAFQYPIEISGVTNYDFLRIAYNEKQKYLKQKELDPLEFMQLTQEALIKLKMKTEFLNRSLNEGFSGGKKKRNEILQMLLLDPKLIILDEIDSGLDIDAIKIIWEAIAKNKSSNSSLIIITHYPRIIDYLKPTHIHILNEGKIIKTGDLDLIEKLEKEGYEGLLKNKPS
uniref:Iron-sulfur cluster formation ABC transporter ATP-biding subunit n=1 Tax=Mallomonas splendens TaxID=52552 RepID=A0A3G2QZG3_9STRA|nr:iron-sulfur cluster formation ABC transporter ATP-biding subunit [Mallomonas splendens]AYO28516.1 iron-sulfur cluster formation ABC transporter ATP-biding subunit [Mallomonas splendens]